MTMKNLASLFLLFSTFSLHAQTTLFSEKFEGATQSFTLNTTDQSSVSGASGANYWVVNNAYTGGAGSLVCLGFPFTFTINNTPTQPAGVTNGPTSKYMHISSAAAAASGINCASFTAADGLCVFDEKYFTKMSTDVNTVGFDSVEFSFYWLCAGGPQSYGEVYYSTNGGNSWQLISTPSATLNNQSVWAERKISLPDFEQKTTLRFGFRFVNNQASSASDPSLGIDEVAIKGFVIAPAASVSAPTFSGNVFCPDDAVTVTYTTGGTFNAGNIFTAQLSNANGSFATPTNIGQVTATVATPINATIPSSAQAGTGYRMRITSSNPAVTGTDNGTNLTIGAYPNVSFNSIVNGLNVQFINNSTGGTAWTWDFGDGNNSTLQNPAHAYATEDTFTVCLNATGTSGCSETVCDSIVIALPSGFEEAASASLSFFPNPADEIIHLTFESTSGIKTIELLSFDGKLIQAISIAPGTQSLPLWIGHLHSGLYLFRFTESGKSTFHKLVKR
jgi:PKD repeat protein